MSAGKDIAHILLFEDFDPEEVEALAATPRKPSDDIVMVAPFSLGDEYHFPVVWLGTPVGEWILSRKYRYDDPDAEGFFIPTSIAEENFELSYAEGTRDVVMIEIENWIRDHGRIGESFDPDEVESVADAAVVEPYFEAVSARRISGLTYLFDKQFFRIYKDVKREGHWKLADQGKLIRLKNTKTGKMFWPESMLDDLEKGKEFVGQIWVTIPLVDGTMHEIIVQNGALLKLRKIRQNGT